MEWSVVKDIITIITAIVVPIAVIVLGVLITIVNKFIDNYKLETKTVNDFRILTNEKVNRIEKENIEVLAILQKMELHFGNSDNRGKETNNIVKDILNKIEKLENRTAIMEGKIIGMEMINQFQDEKIAKLNNK